MFCMKGKAMSNETDLDWLARNVHKWPAGDHQPWCYVYWKGGQRAVSGNCITIFQPCVRVEMSEWLARRAELQNKPSWDDFGESAKFMAQDSDGAWMAFESEPAANYHVWSSMRGWCGYAREGRDRCRGEVLGDWRDTLEKRPEQAKFEPFVSVEDAATAKQPAPKGSGNPILGMVLADLANRALEGKEKYGEPLLAHNGRNPLWDAYQEALDLAMYLRQAIEELG